VLIGLAPKVKNEAGAASSPTLVQVVLTKEGQAKLKCPTTKTLDAIVVGGTDKAPSVISFPTKGCPAKAAVFSMKPKKPLGRVTTVKTSAP
jgi:hypothetical protein